MPQYDLLRANKKWSTDTSRQGTSMFAANDVLNPRIPDEQPQLGRAQVSKIKSAATLSGAHLELYEKTHPEGSQSLLDFLDTCLAQPPYQEVAPQFKHLPVHDAESVYKLIAFFFLRARAAGHRDEPELDARSSAFMLMASQCSGNPTSLDILWRAMPLAGALPAFLPMLQAMNDYFQPAWYAVDASAQTGGGEKFEFHAHGFLQRLLMREIVRLRQLDQPADRRGRVDGICLDVGMPLRIVDKNGGAPDSRYLRRLMEATDRLARDVTGDARNPPPEFPFEKEVLEVQIDKERERLWYAIDQIGWPMEEDDSEKQLGESNSEE